MPAKSGKPKVAPKHPSYLDMVKEAIAATGKPVRGSSRAGIAKYLEDKYGKVLGSHMKSGLRLAIAKAVKSGVLVQTKGSFRLSKAAKKPKKVKKPKKAKKVKKPKAKKVKKPKAKKATKAKKPKVAKKASKKAAKPSKKKVAAGKKKATKPKKAAKKAAKPKKAPAAAPAAPAPAQ